MKNKHLPSVELFAPQEVVIHYKRPLFTSMVHITNSVDAVHYLRLFIKNKQIDHKEFFWVMLLNRANRVLAFSEIGSGSDAGVIINHKEILQLLLLTSSTYLLAFHNHPSGNLTPSNHDKKQTQKLKEMTEILSFKLLDHIIITSESYYSFADNDLI